MVRAFELDADGEVVARGAPAVQRPSSVPSARFERHVLRDTALAVDEQVRGYPHVTNRIKVRMCLPWQRVAKQLVDPTTAEIPRRQADAVDHDEVERGSARSGIEIRRRNAPCTIEPSGCGIDTQRRATNC